MSNLISSRRFTALLFTTSALAVLALAPPALAQNLNNDVDASDGLVPTGCANQTALTPTPTDGRFRNIVSGRVQCLDDNARDNIVSGGFHTLGTFASNNTVRGSQNSIGDFSTGNHVDGFTNTCLLYTSDAADE